MNAVEMVDLIKEELDVFADMHSEKIVRGISIRVDGNNDVTVRYTLDGSINEHVVLANS